MFIRTNDSLPTDTFDESGTVTSVASYLNFVVKDDIIFVEDTADLSSITYTEVASTPDLVRLTNALLRKYLASTDWYVIRNTEKGTAIPSSVTTMRDKFRASISG